MDQIVKDLALKILQEKALDIHDIPNGEKPFLYSSGNWGPGYAMIKGLVGKKWLMKELVWALAHKVAKEAPYTDFVAANATGGMVPGWILSDFLEKIMERPVPYVYVRGTRKKGGHGELITGIANNDLIAQKNNALIVEELVNFAETTCNSADEMRTAGFRVSHGACILFYDNPVAKKRMADTNIKLIHLLTLPEILDVAESEGTHSKGAINDYRSFLHNPQAWQDKYGFKKVESGGTQ